MKTILLFLRRLWCAHRFWLDTSVVVPSGHIAYKCEKCGQQMVLHA